MSPRRTSRRVSQPRRARIAIVRPRPARNRFAEPVSNSTSVKELAFQVKEELRIRYSRGERPAVHEYIDRHPALAGYKDRVVSLVYLEFCLREQYGERPQAEEFCNRYEPWRDSLMSQLNYHEAFSRVLGPAQKLPTFPEPGDHFLWFRLDAELGQGGSARVYLARDESLGDRRVALKVSPDQGDEPSIQGRLDHPHIVPVTLVENDPETGLRGLCMPYVPGLTLGEMIRRIAPDGKVPRDASAFWEIPRTAYDLDPADDRPAWSGFPRDGTHSQASAWIALKLAEALQHAHSRDVLHRDIKPANILLTRRGGPLLLDFNLSQAPSDAGEAEQLARGGTLPYMAPEQLQAFIDPEAWASLDHRADIYSLGLVLREMLEGRRPALPETLSETDRRPSTAELINDLLDLRRDAPPTSVRDTNPAVPHALDAIVARCLQPDRAAPLPIRRRTGRGPAAIPCLRAASICEQCLDSREDHHLGSPPSNLAGGRRVPLCDDADRSVRDSTNLTRPHDRKTRRGRGDSMAITRMDKQSGAERSPDLLFTATKLLSQVQDPGPNRLQFLTLKATLAGYQKDFERGVELYDEALQVALRHPDARLDNINAIKRESAKPREYVGGGVTLGSAKGTCRPRQGSNRRVTPPLCRG